jgi:UDP-N-acetylmuramate dehydrogenase
VAHPSVADVRAAVLAIRRRKAMVIDASDPDTRSVGSFFTNPVITADDAEGGGRCAPGRPRRRFRRPAATSRYRRRG